MGDVVRKYPVNNPNQRPGAPGPRSRSTGELGDPPLPEIPSHVGLGKNTTPKAARLRSRVITATAQVVVVVTGQAVGRVRVRSTSDATSFTPAVGTASLFVTAPRRKVTPERVLRSRLAGEVADVAAAPIVTAAATGRVRVRSTAADPTTFPTAEVLWVNVGSGKFTTPLPARLLSRRIVVPPTAPLVTAQAIGRVRVRGTSTATTVAPTIVTALARGRVRVWSRSNAEAGPDFEGGVIVASFGRAWVAPLGTPAPTNTTGTLDPAFLDLGFVSDDGVRVIENKTVEPKSSWTSLYPKEYVLVGRDLQVELTLREFNKRAVEFALEGSVVTNASEWKHVAFNAAAVSKALVVEWEDGVFNFRLYIPRGMVVADVESQMSRNGASDLPVVFNAHKDGVEQPYTLFMSD